MNGGGGGDDRTEVRLRLRDIGAWEAISPEYMSYYASDYFNYSFKKSVIIVLQQMNILCSPVSPTTSSSVFFRAHSELSCC